MTTHDQTGFAGLSDEGRERASTILDLAIRRQRVVARRRRTARAGLGVGAIALLATVATQFRLGAGPSHSSEFEETIVTDVRAPVIERVAARGPTSIVVTHDRGDGIERLGDDDLLTTLERIGRPTGLIRMEGRAILTSNVADTPALAPDESSMLNGATGPRQRG